MTSILQQRRTQPYAARRSSGKKTLPPATKGNQPFSVEVLAGYPQETVFQPAMSRVIIKLALHVHQLACSVWNAYVSPAFAGWRCFETMLRQAHLSAGHLADNAQNLCKLYTLRHIRGYVCS